MPPTPRPSAKSLGSLAKLFEKELKTPAGRKRFHDDPSVLKELDLPRSIAAHFEDLSYEELRLLAKTWKAMEKEDLTYDVRGVRVSFL